MKNKAFRAILTTGLTLKDVTGKEYSVLRLGKMFSKRYGEIDITETFAQQIVDNFKLGYLETIPFIDEIHDRDKSRGTIDDVIFRDGEVFLKIGWNKKGKQLIDDGEYMYLSVDINTHTDSKTGDEIYPVLFGAGMVNYPVYKDQSILTYTDQQSADTADNNTNLEDSMDLEKMLQEQLAAIQAELDKMSDEEKAAAVELVNGYIAGLQKMVGTPEQEPEGDTELEEKPKDDDKKDPAQMSDGNLKLAEQVNTLTKTVQSQNVQLLKMQFKEKYLNTKITPAEVEDYFSLFLNDQKTTEKILDAREDLKLAGETGSSSDVDLTISKGKNYTLSEKVVEIQRKEKISYSEAFDLFRDTNPAEYKKLTEEA